MFWNKEKISFKREGDRVYIDFKTSNISQYDVFFINGKEAKFSYPPQRAVKECIHNLNKWLDKINGSPKEQPKVEDIVVYKPNMMDEQGNEYYAYYNDQGNLIVSKMKDRLSPSPTDTQE